MKFKAILEIYKDNVRYIHIKHNKKHVYINVET